MGLRVAVLLALAPIPGFGQQSPHVRADVAPPPSQKYPASWYPPESAGAMGPVTGTPLPITGAPFTGTQVMTTEMPMSAQRPPLESRLTVVTRRDAAGDTRTDESAPGRPGLSIEVMDVVHHCRFEWVEPAVTPAAQVASVTCSPLKFSRDNIGVPDAMDHKMLRTTPNVVDDRFYWTETIPLGDKTILGVRVVGQKQTRFRKGQDGARTLEYVSELWWSPDLQELLQVKPIGEPSAFPGFEEVELTRGEPDASFFYPPPSYRIVSQAPYPR